MSASPSRQFVDTNILVYAYDRTDEEKWKRASGLLERLWASREATLSIQVLQEFFHTVTRKLPRPLNSREAGTIVGDLSKLPHHRPGRADLLAAIELHEKLGISFWDAMIVQSARRMGCSVLWTEDLNDGQTYTNVLVRNPFVDMLMEETEEAYGRARKHAVDLLENPLGLATLGQIPWTRDELHERHPVKKAK
jgi:predicted nucleic acid-binding protein